MTVKEVEPKRMDIYWDNRHRSAGLYELRAMPAAMILKLQKMSGGSWIVHCLGDAATLPADLSDTEAKDAAIGWVLPILERLKDSLNALYTK